MSEFIMPSTVEDQKKMMALIKEAVKYKQEIDAQNADIKTVQEDLKEQFGMKPSDSLAHINHFYDQTKIPSKIKDLGEVVANSEILAKYNK